MKIYLIGIGGIAMGNLAYMLKTIGHEVSGSDHNLYPPMSDKLVEWGIQIHSGFHAENVKDKDLIIIGNAISRGNVEVEEVLNSKKEYISMPMALSHFFLRGKKVIVVSGTHGKTTITFLLHHILKSLDLNPGLFVGGIRKDGHPGFEIGKGEYFVVEGDEYDSAFFDKGSKFLHYRPHYLIMTALDYDHADIFENVDAIKVQFRRLIRLVPSNGKIFYWSNSEHLRDVTTDISFTTVQDFDINRADSIVHFENGKLHNNINQTLIETSMIGEHNARNIEVALRMIQAIAPEKMDQAIHSLSTFQGVKRRQDILYKDVRNIVIEDFAHHPVAIQETVNAVRQTFPEHAIISLFEPRSATSHRNVFQKEFAKCFKGSTLALVTEVFNVDKVSEEIRLDVRKLVDKISKKSESKSKYCADPEALLEKLAKQLPKFHDQKIVVLAMSNGSFGGIYHKLIELVKGRQ